ncbi:MAG: tRNA (adenosine(37)-N6)-dimethylallyltransferase MiaA [Candidatus Vogelbacteria bacterium]|nr:tRNA (adenosine(37)-N6)-dimethylallyltransferase MiaA [Candidatus Vogelbacteria bacterium]
MKTSKIIVILGPTASGKSDLGVIIAKKINGEIISADSRQVYRGMDIGSGKITKREMMSIPHHLLDVASPKRTFTVSHYQKLANQKITEIINRNKTPIIVGGTGLYIQSIVDGIVLPEVEPNHDLRQKLEKLSVSQLFTKLQHLDPARAKTIDAKNPRRLIRAIEIATALGKVPKLKTKPSPYDFILIGLNPGEKILKQNIHKRLEKRLKQGMIQEVKKLRAAGLSWKRLESFGLEYRFIAQYLQSKITKEEMKTLIEKESWQYAKRQMTWFKRDERIRWIAKLIDVMGLIKTK